MTEQTIKRSAHKAAEGAAFLCFALALSYFEAIIPVFHFLAIPGFKLGLANLAVVAATYRCGPSAAFAVSISRIILSTILFGSASSFIFSLFGAVFSFLSLLLSAYIIKDRISFIGVSVLSALFHNIGQSAAALIILRSFAVLYYFPALLFSSAAMGMTTGIVLYTLPRRFFSKGTYLYEKSN